MRDAIIAEPFWFSEWLVLVIFRYEDDYLDVVCVGFDLVVEKIFIGMIILLVWAFLALIKLQLYTIIDIHLFDL